MPARGTTINHRAQQILAAALLLCALVALAPVGLEASALLPSPARASAKDPSGEPATIEFWNRPIATLRSSLAGADPQDRAKRAASHINDLPLTVRAADIELHPIKVEDQDGIGFASGNGTILFFLGTNDLDEESGETLASASKAALQRLDEALIARESERSWPVIRRGLLFTLLGLALLVLFWWLVWKAYHLVFDYLHKKESTFPYRMRFWGIEFLPHFAGALYTVLRVFIWMFTLGALYSWLTVSLGLFPYTAAMGKATRRLCLPLLRAVLASPPSTRFPASSPALSFSSSPVG